MRVHNFIDNSSHCTWWDRIQTNIGKTSHDQCVYCHGVLFSISTSMAHTGGTDIFCRGFTGAPEFVSSALLEHQYPKPNSRTLLEHPNIHWHMNYRLLQSTINGYYCFTFVLVCSLMNLEDLGFLLALFFPKKSQLHSGNLLYTSALVHSWLSTTVMY